MSRPRFLMTDPSCFEVVYRINPWMDPLAFEADRQGMIARAARGSAALKAALEAEGAEVTMTPAAKGLPDLVFPANAAVVFGGRVLLARFRRPERQGEEPHFRAAFEALRIRGAVEEILDLPPGVVQEGAGDCVFDEARGLFWAGYGPRSSKTALGALTAAFDALFLPLELASERFYHLDTCFCPLSGGEVLYHPPAFTPEALARIEANVAPAQRLEASGEDAAAFCVNAVNIGRTVIMAQAPLALTRRLTAAGYRVVEVDLAPFMLSGGAAYCMTLRLDRGPAASAARLAAAG